MSVTDRRELIAQEIARRGEASFDDLAALCDVSEMTIRRDIDDLEAQGVVRRIPGGAISLTGTAAEPAFQARALHAAHEKEHIARAVCDLLTPGETLLLDSGSTVLSVAREIRRRGLPFTVITPSVLAALELADSPGVTVHLTPGQLRPGELSLMGPDTISFLRGYNCDTYVMGVAGVDDSAGISDSHRDEAHVKRTGMAQSQRTIVAADHTKLGRRSLAKICNLGDIGYLITDAPEDHPVVVAATTANVSVVPAVKTTPSSLQA